ncbi:MULTISPECIES: VTT domain-containing protein [Sutcliffiella]|uniref:TVP38/TMEM64 family membrane protein n=1 Tax=Sutcliffiella cohnii TaxID=33932 RepID=A0A223KTL2_9BACI|nr:MULTISPECIES: VTT domain-containing protein [Sutcliffiella]AST92810.1 alkaline phosphatase [Sutcliffiella cohnii]MED4016243.1 VTT domain-containing protein [Sutcliffiella cohnii]WBL14065.1 VTT domain-containing protein [Sutcliffiella sp. NC1]
MDERLSVLYVMVETHWLLASIAFISFHILRQILFIPVVIICVAGGALFGGLLGSVYSIIGLTLSSLLFYLLYNQMPKIFGKILKMKEKWFGHRAELSVGQVTVLRLIPFIHFHLLSLCLIETTKNFREYVRASIIANIPIAIIYTVFGQFIRDFSPSMILLLLLLLSGLFFLVKDKYVIIKWEKFFQKDKARSS